MSKINYRIIQILFCLSIRTERPNIYLNLLAFPVNTQKMGDFVHVNVSNSQNDAVSFEKKFPKDIKISDLKVNKMYKIKSLA